MRPLRYYINVTLDGCCDHRAMFADEDLHRHALENLDQADALLFGRVTYEMMEAAWRPPARTGARPDWMEPFARTIDAAKKYVVSSTLDRVDWNAELVRGDLGKAIQQLKRESGKGLLVGGVKLPLALAELGLIDEYEFVVHPRLAGHGPTLFAGLSKHVDLKLVSRLELGSGAVAMRYSRKASHRAEGGVRTPTSAPATVRFSDRPRGRHPRRDTRDSPVACSRPTVPVSAAGAWNTLVARADGPKESAVAQFRPFRRCAQPDCCVRFEAQVRTSRRWPCFVPSSVCGWWCSFRLPYCRSCSYPG